MLEESLLKIIKTYPDFPKEGILYRDVLPVLQYPKVFSELIEEMVKQNEFLDCDALIGVDARGFLFASAIALKLSKPLIVARKPNKLPGSIITKKYDLEYGSNSLTISEDSIRNFNSFLVIDDLIATGGTIDCINKILKSQNKKIIGLAVVIELVELKGRNSFDFPVFSQVKY